MGPTVYRHLLTLHDKSLIEASPGREGRSIIALEKTYAPVCYDGVDKDSTVQIGQDSDCEVLESKHLSRIFI